MWVLSRDITHDDFDDFDEAQPTALYDPIIEDIHRYRLRIVHVEHLVKVNNNEFGYLGPLSVIVVGGWVRDSRGNRGWDDFGFRFGGMST